MKNFFTVLLYLSLAFLAYYLYKADYLNIPQIHRYDYITYSLLFLIAGCLLQVQNWIKSLQLFNININVLDAFISVGLSVFMKYIPGKVMVVLGRAAYISSVYQKDLKITSSASLLAQFIMLWSGMLLGLFILFNNELDSTWQLLGFLALGGFTIAIFFPVVFEKMITIINSTFKKNITFPSVKMNQMIAVLPFFIMTWLCWSIGFYFLAAGLYEHNISLLIAMAFPLAASLAIIALIAPGGLGVREGLLVAFLLLFNIPTAEATTIALASRLWFLIGEFFLFGLAFVLKYKS